MSKHETCPACGSHLSDREKKAAGVIEEDGEDSRVTSDLIRCESCGGQKCIMCDMGDDVENLCCTGNPEDDEDGGDFD